MELQKQNTKLIEVHTNDLRASIFKSMVLVGFKVESLLKEELDVIIDYLQRNFSTFKHENIVKAFEMGVKGSLDIDLKHYNSFNVLYISNVFQSYKRFLAKENAKPKPFIEVKPSKLIEAKKLSKEEDARQWYSWLKTELKERSRLSEFIIADWSAIFYHMEINKILKLNNDEKEMFLDVVKADLNHEIQKRKAEHRDYKIYLKILNNKKSLQRECRKRIILKHFENEKNKTT